MGAVPRCLDGNSERLACTLAPLGRTAEQPFGAATAHPRDKTRYTMQGNSLVAPGCWVLLAALVPLDGSGRWTLVRMWLRASCPAQWRGASEWDAAAQLVPFVCALTCSGSSLRLLRVPHRGTTRADTAPVGLTWICLHSLLRRWVTVLFQHATGARFGAPYQRSTSASGWWQATTPKG